MPGYRVENIAPILNVQDIARSLNFYIGLRGFKVVSARRLHKATRELFTDISVINL
jgi:hypothetical protein